MKRKKVASAKKPSKLSAAGQGLIRKISSLKTRKVSLIKKPKRKSSGAFVPAADFISVQQEIASAKFFTGGNVAEDIRQQMPTELPHGYSEDKIILQVRDPWWLHTYWEIKGSTVEELKNRLNSRFDGAQSILRVYDISSLVFDGTNAHRHFDINVGLEVKNWYIDTGGPGRSWCIDIGFKLKDGTFIMIARSNAVTTPLDGPSWVTDEEWMIPDELFARLYGLGFGFGPASPTGKEWFERMKVHIGSPGLFSISSPTRPVPAQQKDFWLVANTELIVYGATKPDAHLTVCGKPIKLNADGTFSLRFSLPDGRQIIPIEARPPDGSDYRSITPIVSKKTH